ncbi:cation-transporting ATPase [Aureococcus anophagefferens]|nr:cation-transporting ATPase [Aureococcus anophagefferens]
MPSADDDAAHVLRIGGMTCGHCVGAVTSALEGVAGVARADVDLERGLATVAAAPGASLALADLVDAVEASGFDASDAAGGGGAATTQTLADGTAAVAGAADPAALAGAVRAAGYHLAGDAGEGRPPPRRSRGDTKDGDDATWSVVELRVEGMTCAACASRVAKALRSLGVDDISVNCATDAAAFRALGASPALVTRAVAAVKQAGYASSPDTARVEAEGEKAASDDPHVAKTTLATKGMICPSCPPRIQRALKRLDGVRDVTVFLVLDAVEVLYDARIVGPRLLAHRLSQLGYDASVQADDDGVDVAGEERARKLARVAEVRAFRRRARRVRARAPSNALAGRSRYLAVEALGSLLLATPVQFVLGFRFYVGAFNSLRYGTANMDVLVALGTSAAYFYSIYVLYEVSGNRPCCRKFRQCSDGGGHGHHGSHADDADCVSGHHFFETSSVLIAFVLLGKFMEAKAKGRTSEALQALLSLQPKMATVSHTMDDGGDYEEVVDAGSLSRGDVVKIKPGEAVPDGAVVSGESNCDASMLTGESMPVEKRPADDDKEAAGKWARSRSSPIVKLVEQAQGSKTQIEALADYVARNFVAGVVAVAVAAFALWFSLAATEAVPRDWYDDEGRFLFAFLFSIAVLVVACPCALGLATPTAVMVGTGLGARYGVLIKGGRPLEVAHKVSAVVFDKTGTLTRGNRTCRPWTSSPPLPRKGVARGFAGARTTATATRRDALLDAVGVAESGSEHPLASALVATAAEARGGGAGGARDSASSPSTPRRPGVSAALRRADDARRRSSCSTWARGTSSPRPAAAAALGPSATRARPSRPTARRSSSSTRPSAAAPSPTTSRRRRRSRRRRVGDVVGMIGVADIIRDEAARVVSHLQSNLGIEVWMLTGDNERTAQAIARQCGISRVLAKVRPDDKARNVTSLMDQGHVVAMVGDGVNDSPALAAADLGVAIGAGAQIAVETADVVLIRSVLDDVATAIEVSRATFGRIKANLFFAGLQRVGHPHRRGALYPFLEVRLPPEVAALAMVLSSVSVVASSLSLRSYKPPSACRAGDGDPRSAPAPCAAAPCATAARTAPTR